MPTVCIGDKCVDQKNKRQWRWDGKNWMEEEYAS
jgi:hypothetical protein